MQSFKYGATFRPIYITSRRYCENKSIYQRDEEGEKPRFIYGKPYPEWRKPWIKRQGEFYSKLSLFVINNPSPDMLNAIQQMPNLTFQKIKDWWTSVKEIQEIVNQKYLPERVASLGVNLAAVHFFTYRGCAVRLRGEKSWISGDISTINLPDHYTDGYLVEAVDCSTFHHNGIRYEGLENLHGLHFLKWLSVKNNKHIDVWCLDRIAGQNGKSLEYLDISGCKLCVGSVFALAKMSALKYLIISDPEDNVELQSAFSLLELENPKLSIKAVHTEPVA